jgi:hypothetical protein
MFFEEKELKLPQGMTIKGLRVAISIKNNVFESLFDHNFCIQVLINAFSTTKLYFILRPFQ